MAEDPAAELARADQMIREADDLEKQVAALRKQARRIIAQHRNHSVIAALNKALDGSDGNDT